MVLNTSLNRHGTPIIHTPTDAIDLLKSTDMDELVIGSYTVKKYSSAKIAAGTDSWTHSNITLLPLNLDYEPIIIDPGSAEDFKIVAEFVAILNPENE